jgi:hypothetical protein
MRYLHQVLNFDAAPGQNNTHFFRGHWHLSHQGDEGMVAEVSQDTRLGDRFNLNYGFAQTQLKMVLN